jgi:hypothetical protein
MANKGFDDVINELAADYQKVATRVLKNVARQVQADIVKESRKYLREYYSNFKPQMYKRTRKLHKAIVPVFEDNSTGENLSFTVGVEYRAGNLVGYYKSNSWYHQSGGKWISRYDDKFNWDGQNNGQVEESWILDNFLIGEHGGAQLDSNGTYTLMEYFFENELPERINNYVETEMIKMIMKKL